MKNAIWQKQHQRSPLQWVRANQKSLSSHFQWVWANRTLFLNTGSLVSTLVITSALGFVYWWVAARRFTPEAVGLASAAVSAMSFLATFCLLGLGTLLITELPRRKGEEASLISGALIVVGVTGGVAGALFALIVASISPEFQALRASFSQVLLFASGVSLTAITLILDQVCIALLRGVFVLGRNVTWSIVKLGALFALSLWLNQATGMTIYATWALGNLVSLLPFVVLFRKFGHTARVRYMPSWDLLRKLGLDALLHHILNLIVQTPTLVLPLIVTVLLSASANAWFYIASLITTFLFALTVSLTIVLHAINPTEPLLLRQKTRLTLIVATVTTATIGAILLIGTRWILALFGPGYAEHALWSLRLLTLGALPLIIKNHYLAISRVQKRISHAIAPITIGTLLELGVAVLGARLGGLTGLSLGWICALYLESLFLFPLVYRTITYQPAATWESQKSSLLSQ